MKLNQNTTDEDIIDEFLENESHKKKIDFRCDLINYFSLFPTLIYNVYFFLHLKNILENIQESEIDTCSDLFHWTNYTLTWCIFSFLKALFFLFVVKLCIGNENDCNIFCLLLKILTSLVPSIVFILNIPDYTNKFQNSKIENLSNAEQHCLNMTVALNYFYKWEYAYILFILFIVLSIPCSTFIMGLKEYIKSRGYSKAK